jgi:hypothetical protein
MHSGFGEQVEQRLTKLSEQQYTGNCEYAGESPLNSSAEIFDVTK